MEPATNRIWAEAVKTLERKPDEERTEFEQHTYARLIELEALIAQGNESLTRLKEHVDMAMVQVTKSVGAYENMVDLLATYYVTRMQEQRGKDEEAKQADNADGEQSDSDSNVQTVEASN